MKLSKPVFRGLLILEVLVAFTYPCIALFLATILAPHWINSFISMTLDGLLTAGMLLGGYLGMIGVFIQLKCLLWRGSKSFGWKTYLFTFVGCIAVLPLSNSMLKSDSAIVVLGGLAPILVAIQLTFMNRQQMYLILKR